MLVMRGWYVTKICLTPIKRAEDGKPVEGIRQY